MCLFLRLPSYVHFTSQNPAQHLTHPLTLCTPSPDPPPPSFPLPQAAPVAATPRPRKVPAAPPLTTYPPRKPVWPWRSRRTAARARMKMASCPARVTSGSAFTKAFTRAKGSLERRAPGALVGAWGCGAAASPLGPSSSRGVPLPAAAAIRAPSVLRAAADCARARDAGPFPARAGGHAPSGRVAPPLTRLVAPRTPGRRGPALGVVALSLLWRLAAATLLHSLPGPGERRCA